MRRWAGALFLALLAGAACGRSGEERLASRRASLVAAGDIASCWWRGDGATGLLLDRLDGVIAPLGDLAYQRGSEAQFADCYGPTWGRHRERTRPAIGNHDRRTEKGGPYHRYFGARAGKPGEAWYAYELDGWKVVVLNTETDIDAGSPQLRWLAAELRTDPKRCTLAYMHRPRFSSGDHGGTRRVLDAWRVMYDGGVDVVLAGHDHLYERFAPLTPDGEPDAERGIVSFVVGTGGAPLYSYGELEPHSVIRQNTVHGVLALRFEPEGYEWEFVPVAGEQFEDRGKARCH
jgi:3',5'-cyclic AMP phosphodiesterase CpdA